MSLIECTAGPTETPVAGTMYSFERDKHGRYVCEVHNPKHVECFLAVVHFQEVGAEPEPEEPQAAVVQVEPPVPPAIVPPAEPVIMKPASVVAPPAKPAAPVSRVRMAPYAPMAPIPPITPILPQEPPVATPIATPPALDGVLGLGQKPPVVPADGDTLTPPDETVPPVVDPAIVRAELAKKAANRRATRRRKGK